jgi:MFS family permease
MSWIRVDRRLTTLAASLGWSFAAYIITVYVVSVPLITAELNIPVTVPGVTIGSVFLVGYTIGTIGVCADILGRRIAVGCVGRCRWIRSRCCSIDFYFDSPPHRLFYIA